MITIEVYCESPECMPSGQKTDEPIGLGGAIEVLVFKVLAKGAVTERLSEGQIIMRMHLIGGWSRMVTFTGGPEDLGLLRSILTRTKPLPPPSRLFGHKCSRGPSRGYLRLVWRLSTGSMSQPWKASCLPTMTTLHSSKPA